jgi:hypothetical protein
VIDSQDSLSEVHDENDPFINNNKGYGVLSMDTIEFIDVGQVVEKAYQDITFQMGNSPPTSTLYLPLGTWTENLRIDMQAVDGFEDLHSLGIPFEIAVYQSNWENPESDFSFAPGDGDPPAVILVDYAGAVLTDFNEADLKLYRLDYNWTEATCPGYEVARFPEDDRMAVPVCQSGIFVLSDQQPVLQRYIYIPAVLK